MASPVGLAVIVAATLMAQNPTPVVRPALPRPDPPQKISPTIAALFPDEAPPSEATLGVTVYPAAQFLSSYDAGRGQRYYLYGSSASMAELVAYYRTLLKQKGAPVFDTPPVHMFEIGKYDNNTMAFPPGVTIKDYTADGNGGYLNPKPGASPARFPTVIQIVPPVTPPAR